MAYNDDSRIARMHDGDYGTARTPSGDVAFYVEEARRSGGPVLEFGCGTGRVLAPTLDAGVAIDGVDASGSMLAQAAAKTDGRARLEEGDMRDHDMGKTYALVTVPFRALQHLMEPEDHLRAFANFRRHLAPGGRLVFDVYQPQPHLIVKFANEEVLQFEREEDGKRIRRYGSTRIRLARQTNEVTFRWEVTHPDGRVEEFSEEFDMRWFHRYEVEHALARSGLVVEAVYGDFARNPLGDESPEMVFVCRGGDG